jgi:hypothetical protein
LCRHPPHPMACWRSQQGVQHGPVDWCAYAIACNVGKSTAADSAMQSRMAHRTSRQTTCTGWTHKSVVRLYRKQDGGWVSA